MPSVVWGSIGEVLVGLMGRVRRFNGRFRSVYWEVSVGFREGCAQVVPIKNFVPMDSCRPFSAPFSPIPLHLILVKGRRLAERRRKHLQPPFCVLYSFKLIRIGRSAWLQRRHCNNLRQLKKREVRPFTRRIRFYKRGGLPYR